MVSKDRIKIISEQKVYDGYCCVKSYQVQYRLFSGEWSKMFTREVLMREEVGGILLYDPDRDEVVLIEQFRIAAITGENPWLIECVAGVRENEKESLEELVRREASEEAGIDILELFPIHRYWSSPGIYAERVHLFCGRVNASQASGIHGLESEGEDIRVYVIKSEEAFEMVREGVINNALAIIALQWLELNKKKVF